MPEFNAIELPQFPSTPLFVPTGDKVRMVNALSRTGLKKIEVTSFTSSKAIPALQDGIDDLNCGKG